MALSGNKEVVFDLDAAAFSSDDFRMYQFKVKRCPRARPHDWTQCPFAHPGEKAKRRDPRRYRYSGTACPEFRRNGCCRRGDACPFAHGVFECWLHPSRYRTQMCTDGANCKRRVCFFAHTESELRKPEEDPVWVQQQLQAELAAEQQLQQQVNALKIFSALLASSNQPPVLPGASTAASGIASNGLFEMLKSASVGSLASLLGLATTPAAAPAPVSTEDKLRGVLQQLQQGQNSLTLLQLISLLEKVQQQQPAAAPVASTPAPTSSTALPADTASASDMQLKLAQQLASESLQAQLAQLQKVGTTDANKSALDVLSLLTGAAATAAPAAPAAPENEITSAAASSIAASSAASGTTTAAEASAATASSSSTPIAEPAPAPSAPVSSLAGIDPAVAAALLQQPALLQLAAAASAVAKEPVPPANPLANLSALEGLLSQLSLVQLGASATTPAPAAMEPSTPNPPTPTTPAVEHSTSDATGPQATGEHPPGSTAPTSAEGTSTPPAASADAVPAAAAGDVPSKESVLRNAKALLETLNAKGTPPPTEKVAADGTV